MQSTQPPRMASWLLRHFGCSPNNESLVGDLNEQYRQGRSYFCYWREVILAIVVSFFKEVWNHKLLAIRALLIWWIMKAAWLSAFSFVYGASARRLFSAGIEASMFVALMGIIAMTGTSWIIAHTHRAHYRPMLLLYLLLELIGPPLTFISKGLLGVYYWIFPLTQVLNAIFSHAGIFNFIGALWASAGITVSSILIGGGFFRSDAQANSAKHQPATV
jgi:hypothetical protein